MRPIKRLTALLLALCLVLTAMPTAAFAADDTATVTVNVTYKQTEARSMLELVNEFRTGDDAWAWDSTDSEQVYYTGLSELAYDYALEEAAMQRAAEIALSYSHTRPNGTSCFTAYSWNSAGENIAAGTALNTAEKAFALWQETDESYSGQGHRRNMLSSSVTAVAVACVYYNGCYYWVQEFRKPASSQAATTANDSATDVDVEIALSDATVTVTASASSLSLTVGETASLPTLTTKLQMSNAWPSRSGPVTAEATWTVGDESCATLSDGVVTAVAAGSTTLTATVLGETVSVSVTVEEAACEHVTEIQNARDATCTEDGYTGDEVCTICGETVTVGETIPATGHSYAATVTEPTCTTGGYTTYTCSVCGDSYVGDETDATGHSYTYTSNGDGTHTVSCAQGDLTAYSESCTYEDGVCVSCGASEPETSTVVASGDCGDDLTWVLDSGYTLTIDGSGKMTDFTSSSAAPWYDYASIITTIVINEGATSIGDYAFYKCHATAITIPNSVLSIGSYAFSESYITSVVIPDCVEKIGDRSFRSCSKLQYVYIGSNADMSITRQNITYNASSTTFSPGNFPFELCNALEIIDVSNENSNFTSIGGILYDKSGETLICYPSKADTESFIIPDTVTTIAPSAFYYCVNLTSVTFNEMVSSIEDETFYGCTNLTDIEIPNNITSIGDNAFYNCSSLIEITIPASVTDIGDGALAGCRALKKVDILGDILILRQNIFYSCTSLENIIIPDSVLIIESNAFYSCNSLQQINLPQNLSSIGTCAFRYCSALTEINIPANIDTIDTMTFEVCTSLTSISLPEGITTIGMYAFNCDKGLTSVTIPSSVTSINYCAFAGCTGLIDVYYAGSEDEWNAISIDSGNTYLTKATIHYNCHTHSYGDPAFTWSEDYSTATAAFICSVGGETETVDAVVTSTTTVAPTCTEAGSAILTATVTLDGETYTDTKTVTIAATGHSYEAVITEPTCTTGGYTTYTCSVCGDSYVADETAATGHSYKAVVTEPTCTTGGYTTYTCSVCGDSYIADETDATGHTYTTPTWAWNGTSSATATFTCSVCGEQETAAATITYEVTTAATYTAVGTGTYTATVTFNGKTYTDTKTVTIPMLVLTAPTITSLYNSTSGVSVGWDAVDGATSYIVWRLNNSTGKWEKCATTTGTTYLSTSPVSGTTYYYAIEAVNGEVTSGRGTQRYILYMATPKVSLENTTSGIKVSWNSVTGATSGYQVYRRTADTDYVQLTSTTSLTYTDTTAEAGVRYYYIVRSVRGSARSAYASQYITRLTTPTGISVSNTKSGVQVTWSAVTGATSYQVWRKLSGSSSWSKVGTTTGTSYTSTGVTSGKTYVFTVKAVYNSSVSAYNTTGKTIMRLAEPTITLENLVGGLTASWNAVDGAEGYKLYRRSETGSYVLVATLDADTLTYTDKAAGAGIVYYYRVQAYNGSYTSSWTSQFNRRIGHTTLSLAKGEDGVVLTWTKSGGCTGYYIYRMNEDGSYTRIKTITSADTLTWTDTDVELTPGNSYTYYIRGYNGSSLGSYTPKTILIEA